MGMKVASDQQIDGEIFLDQIVTSARINGSADSKPLSRFSDDIWILPDDLFPPGTSDAFKKLRFDNIPDTFQKITKLVVRRYYTLGRSGFSKPRGGTLVNFLKHVRDFLLYLDRHRVTRLNTVTTLLTAQYIDFCNQKKNRQGQPLSKHFLENRFAAVEQLHEHSQFYEDKMTHPWPESTARALAQRMFTQKGTAKTPIIPDEQLAILFSKASSYLDDIERTISLQGIVEAAKAKHKNKTRQTREYQVALMAAGHSGSIRDLNETVKFSVTACHIIILVTSGIRIHELASLKTHCCYSTVDQHSDRYYWLKGVSEKTGEGSTEWMVPEVASKAIAALENLYKPYHRELEDNYKRAREEFPNTPLVQRLETSLNSLVLGKKDSGLKSIQVLSQQRLLKKINDFADHAGTEWHFTPHQFRRNYAIYAAKSALGDLRYLRDHFKHWSMDMTFLYALNDAQEPELYDEVMVEVINEKISIVAHWLDPTTVLAGGASEQIRVFRDKNQPLRTVKDRRSLAEKVSSQVFLRATTVGWCTADDGGCVGGNLTEKTRCSDCGNSIIEHRNKRVWEGIYEQQLELLQIKDVGPGGKSRIQRDINRCEHILRNLGYEFEGKSMETPDDITS